MAKIFLVAGHPKPKDSSCDVGIHRKNFSHVLRQNEWSFAPLIFTWLVLCMMSAILSSDDATRSALLDRTVRKPIFLCLEDSQLMMADGGCWDGICS